jgi:hypothetical protein
MHSVPVITWQSNIERDYYVHEDQNNKQNCIKYFIDLHCSRYLPNINNFF